MYHKSDMYHEDEKPAPPPPRYIRPTNTQRCCNDTTTIVGESHIVVSDHINWWWRASACAMCACAVLTLTALVIAGLWNTNIVAHSRYQSDKDSLLDNGGQGEYEAIIQTKVDKNIKREPKFRNIDKMKAELPRSKLLEKISMIKDILTEEESYREEVKSKNNNPKRITINLESKSQLRPETDVNIQHPTRKIEKKDRPKSLDNKIDEIPAFKPMLPDIFINSDIKLPDGYVASLKKHDDPNYYSDEYFYDDQLFYEDYVQSDSLTNYILEKVQELYEWLKADPDFENVKNSTKLFNDGANTSLTQFFMALNASIVNSNATIVMSKLKELYFKDNITAIQFNKSTFDTNDLFSFGMLSLDSILLHNIQVLAWNSQETVRERMLSDPEVFAFNALFMEKSSVETMKKDVMRTHIGGASYLRHQSNVEPLMNIKTDEDTNGWSHWGRTAFEGVLEIGLGTARAALYLARAYKNSKTNIVGQSWGQSGGAENAQALERMRASYGAGGIQQGITSGTQRYTELDCLWYLYCTNLVATSSLPSPYGTMAKINGFALRIITGFVPSSRAVEAFVLEALSGYTPLQCKKMLPKCSDGNAANVVLDSILQPHKTNIAGQH